VNSIPWKLYKGETIPLSLLKEHPYSDSMEILTGKIITEIRGLQIIALPGYATDFASIPRAFRWFIDYDDDRIKRAAICHDILFNKKFGTLGYCASIMYDIMIRDGIPRWKAKVIRRAVETHIAERLFDKRDLFDLENSKFCRLEIPHEF